MPRGPTHAIVAVTERCNARCEMCDIWKRKAPAELPANFYERLPGTLREINVTGGEPLLRDDIADVIRAMRRAAPKARIVLSTNGLLPSRLEALLEAVPGLVVRISLDAIGELHDTIRGVKGAFESVLESIRIAKRVRVKDLGISATISKFNVSEAKRVQDFAFAQGISFTVTTTHSSEVFFGNQSEKQPDPEAAIVELRRIQKGFFRSFKIKDWFKGYFVGGLIDMLSGRQRRISCGAGIDFFYLDPEGNIYPCHLWEESMGNLTTMPYEEIVHRNGQILSKVTRCKKNCWMTCTLAPEMQRHLLSYALKVLMAKIRYHLHPGNLL